MPTLSSTSLALAISLAAYLHARCMTEPNPPPAKAARAKSDRLAFIAGSLHKTARRSITAASLYHALLTLYYPPNPSNVDPVMSRLCPRPANLSAELFTWSRTTVISLLSMFLGAAIRLSAFGSLGRSFTFRLAAPDKLVTSGIHRFMQHPSYTGLTLLTVPSLWLVFGWNASVACFVDEHTLRRFHGWEVVASVALIVVSLSLIGLRVRDEEKMLREKFGDEWVAYHKKTKRFIPGVF